MRQNETKCVIIFKMEFLKITGAGFSCSLFFWRCEMSLKWWKCAGIRALKTVAQTAVATIGTCAFLQDVNWVQVVSASILAGILSLLTSLGGLPEVDDKECEDE